MNDDCDDGQNFRRQKKQQQSNRETTHTHTPQKKKKNAQLVLRLNKDLRDSFVEACQDLDTSAAREVRRFIKKFLKRYENGEFDE